jgi:4-carboxymuconolactone decarboxylase
MRCRHAVPVGCAAALLLALGATAPAAQQEVSQEPPDRGSRSAGASDPAIDRAERAIARLQGGRIERPASYDALTPEQRAYVGSVLDGPRSDIPPPLAVMLASPGLGDLVQRATAYARFAGQDGYTSLPPKLNELAILMAARRWNGEYVWHAHHDYAVRVGLGRDVVDAVREGRRPTRMEPDVEAVYDFLDELAGGQVSDGALARARAVLGGDRGVIDLVGSFGLYSISSMLVMIDQSPLPDGVGPYLVRP